MGRRVQVENAGGTTPQLSRADFCRSVQIGGAGPLGGDSGLVEKRGRAALFSVRRHLGKSVGVLMVDSIRLTQPTQRNAADSGRFCCYLHELDLGSHDASGLPLQHTRLELGFRLSDSGWEVTSVRFDTLWRPQVGTGALATNPLNRRRSR